MFLSHPAWTEKDKAAAAEFTATNIEFVKRRNVKRSSPFDPDTGLCDDGGCNERGYKRSRLEFNDEENATTPVHEGY